MCICTGHDDFHLKWSAILSISRAVSLSFTESRWSLREDVHLKQNKKELFLNTWGVSVGHSGLVWNWIWPLCQVEFVGSLLWSEKFFSCILYFSLLTKKTTTYLIWYACMKFDLWTPKPKRENKCLMLRTNYFQWNKILTYCHHCWVWLS